MAAEVSLTDPTKPLNYKVKSPQKRQRAALPKLSSILAGVNQHNAILNNKLYKTGQWINGYQITSIKRDAVFLRDKKKSYKLSLYPSEMGISTSD